MVYRVYRPGVSRGERAIKGTPHVTPTLVLPGLNPTLFNKVISRGVCVGCGSGFFLLVE